MAREKRKKDYIVFIWNSWSAVWKRHLMTKEEVEDYIEEHGTGDVIVFKAESEVKFKKVFELED
jgi:hypothetical protein